MHCSLAFLMFIVTYSLQFAFTGAGILYVLDVISHFSITVLVLVSCLLHSIQCLCLLSLLQNSIKPSVLYQYNIIPTHRLLFNYDFSACVFSFYS